MLDIFPLCGVTELASLLFMFKGLYANRVLLMWQGISQDETEPLCQQAARQVAEFWARMEVDSNSCYNIKTFAWIELSCSLSDIENTDILPAARENASDQMVSVCS